MLKTIPYNNVFPMLALKIVAKATGPGCGGRKPWVMDKAEAMGIPTYNRGSFVVLATANTRGMSTTKPAL
jgi:hypothetical protein